MLTLNDEQILKTLNPTHTVMYGYKKEAPKHAIFAYGIEHLLAIILTINNTEFKYVEIQNFK